MLICTYVYGIAIPAPKNKSHNKLGHYKSFQIVFLTPSKPLSQTRPTVVS